MPTPAQIRAIHQGQRFCRLNEQQYRTLLRNVGNVESSTDLDNAGVEDVMAVLEDLGFNRHPGGPRYWRDTVGQRAGGASCPRRMAHKIRELAARPGGIRYDLAALCRQHSAQRTGDVEQLLPREAWKLIEMLKAVVVREEKKQPAKTEAHPPSLFAAGQA
jgi:hypothetical protein